MASNLSIRAVRTTSCSTCRSFARPSSIGSAAVFSRRGLSTSTSASEQTQESNGQPKPRWSYTPPLAKAPFSLRFNSKRPEYPVNSDPKLLDEFYIRMLGNNGDKVLSEEIKWLAVTHKSFDQGRRGFNDRLAFLGRAGNFSPPPPLALLMRWHCSLRLSSLGKRIVQLQVSLALVQGQKPATTPAVADEFGRTPFTHPALDGLSHLSSNTKKFLTSKTKLAELAQKYELEKVLRWSPRKVRRDINNTIYSSL